MSGEGSTPEASPSELHVAHFAYGKIKRRAQSGEAMTSYAKEAAIRIASITAVRLTAIVHNTVRVYVEPGLSALERAQIERKVCEVLSELLDETVESVTEHAVHILLWVADYDEDGTPNFVTPTTNIAD